MEQSNFVIQVIREVPGLGVMLVMVLMFLKHLAKRDEISKQVSEQYQQVHQETSTAIKSNVEALQKHNEVIHDLAKAIDRCRYRP